MQDCAAAFSIFGTAVPSRRSATELAMSAPIIPISSRSTEDLHRQVTAAYEDARDDVYGYVLTLGLSPGQAQEVAQEVFLRLYVSLRNGEDIQNVRGWIFRVAHNFGLKLRAKEREQGGLHEMVLHEPVADEDASPEQVLIRSDRDRRVAAAFAELSAQQRQCLQLRASGLRYREIAETVGIATSTVNEFIRRGVTKLRKALHE